ncbi:putative AC transposase [Typha latifolia]|uniref:putative AC transposase n=1 Tax=Typha latifolia TaxID=4733 RepID=UPI003C2E60F5
MEKRTLMDMTFVPSIEPISSAGPSEKANAGMPLKQRKKSMTSLYLKFFETAPDGKSRRCKFCKQSYSIATATGNLGRHLSHRHPGYDRLSDTGEQMQQAIVTSKKSQVQSKPAIDHDHLNWLLLKWLIGASIPPAALEDEMLSYSFKFLNSSVMVWSKEKVQAVTLEVFRSMREDVRASLEHVNSKVSITLDFWTSYEQVFYMSVKCHWIDESWSLHRILLDVCHIPYPCTSSEIFHALMKVLLTYNIDSKVLSCTNNNSQQAIHACHALKEELDARKIPFCYIPCAGRTLKLIIEDGLLTVKPILSKIREFVLELNSCPEIVDDFKQMAALYQEGQWKFPIDASASWNGDYSMLDLVRKAPNAMDSTIKKQEETFGSRNLTLSATEKSGVNILHSYLEPFYKTTTNLCTCKVPTVGLVLFFMDHVFELISGCRESCRQEWLKNVAEEMAKRARSFSTQVSNLFTFMAAVLDPRIKKELIPENLNSEKNLEEARSHFLRDYSSGQFSSVTNGFSIQDTAEDTDVSFAEEIARKRRRMSMNTTTDELSQYLSEPPAPIATDVLEWWKVNATRYPRLSLMARDYLAVQGTSIEPDELFTSKGDKMHKQQYCLPFSSMQAIMCINSWIPSGYPFKFRSTEIDFEKLIQSAAASVDIVKS